MEKTAMETSVNTIEGSCVATERTRIGLVASRFNDFIVRHLVEGAIDTFVRHGGDANNITLVRVPGAWEIPFALAELAATQQFDALVSLGAVIRGGTPHFDYVAGEVAKGSAQVSLNAHIPIAFGVLTTDTIEQAVERAGTKAGNKGSEAMLTAIEMASMRTALRATKGPSSPPPAKRGKR
jgi:6,7-dimethyl-8-ribityllumazine synthase